MQYKKRFIRHGIKQRASAILRTNIVFAARLCLILSLIYGVVTAIRIYAAPILQVNGESIRHIVDAYLNMSWRDLLSITAINILTVVLIGPVMGSYSEYFLSITHNPNVPENAPSNTEVSKTVGQRLDWFTVSCKRKKSIMLRASIMLLSLFWQAILCGPPLYFLYHLRGLPDSLLYTNQLLIFMTWFLFAYLLAYVRTGMYYPAYFLLAQSPNVLVRDALKDSTRMMKGHAWEYLFYKISFVPWYLFCIITFGLGVIYYVPYRGSCDALFIRYLDAVSSGDPVE